MVGRRMNLITQQVNINKDRLDNLDSKLSNINYQLVKIANANKVDESQQHYGNSPNGINMQQISELIRN